MKNNKVDTTTWEKSRAAYVDYREAKRNLNRVTKQEDRTWSRLDKCFVRFTRAQKDAFLKYEDASQTEKFTHAYETLRLARIEHDGSRKALKEAVSRFKSVEIRYSIVIIRGLEKITGMSVRQISQIFGIWAGNIARWLNSSQKEDIRDLEESYDKEYEDDA